MTDELEWSVPVDDPTRPERTPRGCRRHEWMANGGPTFCRRCNKPKDDLAARRGKNNRARGNAIEREVGKSLGLRRVGQFGGPTDLGETGDMFAVQVKSGGSFSERFWQWLKAVPVAADQTAILVVTDAPGPGHKRRAVVVVDLTDWVLLHGKDGLR